ncbi:MAG TPA: SIMPL domain-containing protein [Pyrinomonadaceae bacterium]|nr:SIMPL domain-containing protein [Pyrinomonadaceae bacterium]
MKRLFTQSIIALSIVAFLNVNGLTASAAEPVEQSRQDPATSANNGITRVLVTGDSVVQAQPDTAILVVSVVTQGKRAIDAQQENATKSEAMIKAVKAAAGAGAEVKTSGYSIQPQRVYKENQPPTIVGYEARNSVTVTVNNLSKVGDVIDAAAEAGANDIANISFTLRQDRQARDRALSEATKTAVGKARVVAEALGGKLLRIVEVQEEGYMRPRPIEAQYDNIRTMKAATPIEVGSLDITSRVQIIAEIMTR